MVPIFPILYGCLQFIMKKKSGISKDQKVHIWGWGANRLAIKNWGGGGGGGVNRKDPNVS